MSALITRRRGEISLWIASGSILLAASAGGLELSSSFEYGVGHADRPILGLAWGLLLLGLFHAALGLLAFRMPPPVQLVVAFALPARLFLVFSNPMQEDDLYRYLWDSRVTQAGLDPYCFSPDDVERYEAGGAAGRAGDLATLATLAGLKQRSQPLGEVFKRINNREYATIYPAGAQLVFRIHATLVPVEWSVRAQVACLKTLLAVFDVATIAALIVLLRTSGLDPGLCVIYAWCPLVLKEISNSGHMDSIPTFFLVASLAAQANGRAFVSGLSLGAAAASKLFAVLALPILLRSLGLKRGLVLLAGFAAVIIPAFLSHPECAERRRDTLMTFACVWEMNDAVFPWIERVSSSLKAPRVAALGAVALSVAALAAWRAWRTTPRSSAADVARCVFTVLAAFFLLGPVGFPWYFTWCVPLLPFVRRRAWFVLPGLLSLYYVRFLLDYTCRGPCFGFESGTAFFDEALVMIEFGAFYALFAVEWLLARGTARRAVD